MGRWPRDPVVPRGVTTDHRPFGTNRCRSHVSAATVAGAAGGEAATEQRDRLSGTQVPWNQTWCELKSNAAAGAPEGVSTETVVA
ncbi:MAG TPA: hypothetical protein VJS67_09480, partial [Pseudonocardiaceae bacterium]|nr:hypothetical protein [Pseudonocardiaceae bacterium]